MMVRKIFFAVATAGLLGATGGIGAVTTLGSLAVTTGGASAQTSSENAAPTDLSAQREGARSGGGRSGSPRIGGPGGGGGAGPRIGVNRVGPGGGANFNRIGPQRVVPQRVVPQRVGPSRVGPGVARFERGGIRSGAFVYRGRHVRVHHGGWRYFYRGRYWPLIAVGGLAAIAVAGAYYYPYSYVEVEQPLCEGLTDDGCQLLWQEVPTSDGGSVPTCVAYCPR